MTHGSVQWIWLEPLEAERQIFPFDHAWVCRVAGRLQTTYDPIARLSQQVTCHSGKCEHLYVPKWDIPYLHT
jgi:hypothetical protein